MTPQWDKLAARLLVIGLVTLSSGCASSQRGSGWGGGISEPNREKTTVVSQRAKTPSGKPEVVIPGASKKAVVDALARQMTGQGYSIGRVDDYKAQFEKPGGFWLDLLAGSRFNSTAIWRISYTMFDTSEGLRVIADMGAVTNPGSGFEKVTEVKGGKNAAAIQSILDAVRDETGRVVLPEPALSDTTSNR